MQFSETLGKFRDLSSLNETFRRKIDNVIDSVREFVKSELTGTEETHPILDEALFRKTLEEWCHRNSEAPARLISIRPWDDSAQESSVYDFGNASKREILQVVHSQFGDAVIMTQLASDVFVIFLTEENGQYVDNEFDWLNKVQGLKTRLSADIPLPFHLETAKWPRDASTALSFLDQATPSETSVEAYPFPTSTEELEEALESVLEVDLREQVERRLPEALREKVPLARFLN